MARKKTVKKAAKKVTKKKRATPKEVKPEVALNVEPVDKVACERELRKYVKRDGGLRKGISDVYKMRALHLMKLLERKEIVWDKSIIPLGSESQGKLI